MKNYNADIGKWLAAQRISRGLMQSEVGEMLGVTKTAIHYWETGKRTIDAATMIKYCHAIGADPQQCVKDVTEGDNHGSNQG